MHSDEIRDDSALDAARRRSFAQDPESAYRLYRTTAAQEQQLQEQLALAGQEVAALRAQVKRLEVSRGKYGRDLAAATRELGSARSALTAYRAQTARLKRDLARVRASRSMAVGRAVLAPGRAVRRVLGARRGGATEDAAVHPAPDAASATGTAVVAHADTPEEGSTAQAAGPGFAELAEQLEAAPSVEVLARALDRGWYAEGRITGPAELLARHADLVSQLPRASQTTAGKIAGTAALQQRGVPVPPRASGTAYLPEPDRLMYCVHATHVFDSNGYAIRTRGVAAGLRAAGADVVVVARPGYPWDVAGVDAGPRRRRVDTSSGIDHVCLPGPALGEDRVDHYLQRAADALVQEARRVRPQLVQAASNALTALPALIAARRVGVPFVYEVRGLWELTEAAAKPGWRSTERFAHQAELERLVAVEADRVLAITQQVADELVRRGVDPARIELAPNGVDVEHLAPLPPDEAYRTQRGLPSDVPVVGFAGSVVPYEGLDVLLRATRSMLDAGTQVQVVVAGSGSAVPDLVQLRDALGLESAVTLLGRLPADEIPRLLSVLDVVVCPRQSTEVTETVSPLKPLEAMGAGRPLVMSDVAPQRELAGPRQERGRLFPSGDADALARELTELLDDDDARAALARGGRLWAVRERTWTALGARVRQAHRRAASAHARGLADAPVRALREVRVGLIADRFTTDTLSASVTVVPLSVDGWQDQVRAAALDVVLVESAWEGNGGQWARRVGHYGEHEFSVLGALLEQARAEGVPSLFWNKEDPVHFARFEQTAAHVDHVFTTDADMVPRYLSTPGSRARTVCSQPFYAQPALHNPLPSRRPPEHVVSYAGSYYGDRYAQRSTELRQLLEAALPYGIAVYDRQHGTDSDYHFPPDLQPHVRGGLDYAEMLEAYTAHPVHLNVNSVGDSPTMFSRRVVEIAASGSVVLSGPGRGVVEVFSGLLPTSSSAADQRALLGLWMDDELQWRQEAWRQLRTVLRAHTAAQALTVMLRTAGLPVAAPQLPSYGLHAACLSVDDARRVARQSVRPTVVTGGVADPEAAQVLADHGIAHVPTETDEVAPLRMAGVCWAGHLDEAVARTHYEDLLQSLQYGDWSRLRTTVHPAPGGHRSGLARREDLPGDGNGLVRLDAAAPASLADALTRPAVEPLLLLVPPPPRAAATGSAGTQGASTGRRVRDVLVAGHDLKFAGPLLDGLAAQGHRVAVDRWAGHDQHDAARSAALLAEADVVFCEWGLGNAVWYAEHKGPHQRLVVRVHLQELSLPYLRRVTPEAVDAFVFVGEHVRDVAVRDHGVPRERTLVIPNAVDVVALDRPKHEGAQFTVGLVGIVPQRKRLDLAMDLVQALREVDDRFVLRVRGMRPEQYSWMQERPHEMRYYREQYARCAVGSPLAGAVVFDEHGQDMPEWYRHVGHAVSVSDFESFHFTLPDGAASGAVPTSLAWPGSDRIYPADWLTASVDEMAARIGALAADADLRQHVVASTREYVRSCFSSERVVARLVDLVVDATS